MTQPHGDHPALPESWREGVKVDWSDRPYATIADYPELDSTGDPIHVRTLSPAEAEEAQAQRRHALPLLEDPVEYDDGARLDSPENHRIQTLQHITDAVEAASRQAEIARRWTAENGYHPEVAKRLAEVVRDLGLIGKLIATHEENR